MTVLRDDPSGFWLLAAQQVPPRLVRILATPVAALARPRTLAGARATALWLLGREHEAVDWVSRDGIAPLRAAAFLVSVKRFESAEKVLREAGVDLGAPSMTTVRLRWHRGELRDAVSDLESLPKRGGGAGERLRGDLALLEPGWSAPVPGGRAEVVGRPDVVLHLLTNSLPFTRSGYTSRTHSILRAQQAAGLQVEAVTRLGYPSTVGIPSASSEDLIDGVRYGRLSVPTLPSRSDERLAREIDAVTATAERVRPSVLHTTTHYVNSLVLDGVRDRTGIPYVYEVRGFLEETWLSKQPPGAERSDRYVLWRERETEAMHSADAVVTLGEEMRQEMVARGVDPAKISLSPNAVGPGFLGPAPDPARRRASLGIAPEDQVVGTVTSVVDYEGLETAVSAVKILQRPGRRVVLLIVGDGAARPRIESLARDAGIDAVFTGRVPAEEVHELHSCIDVFLVPRRDERVCRLVTPMKPLEAMATSRPVVASDLPALREIVDDGSTGRLFAADEPEDLARVLDELLGDPDTMQRMGAAGREFVVRERTWAKNAEMYRALYERLADGRQGAQ
ncbi:glycosyltransferase [Sanguibacter keddieii DSM 10542]|uniref:D-inositol 3-phosphate glycosyltransferase n=1 Tax=Sanguibacter keddieii (strain ATCC 51767 / DSM 10542 / NCFB 3025 / ST-74) TaxID=446469 RepID=D1BC52_SANKS|nr:glycosyltransferase [Sanguibacter keddieii DSM 10542]